jgi:hypothetical protein
MRLLGPAVLLAGLMAMAAPAAAQLLGGRLGLPALPSASLPSANLPPLSATADRLAGPVLAPVAQLVRIQPTTALGRDLLRRNPGLLEADDQGHPLVRGEVTAIAPSEDALARARDAGFSVTSRERLAGLELDTVVLAVPKGLSAPEALRRLRALDPNGRYDVNPIYFESGAVGAPARPAAGTAPPPGRASSIGLLDGAADPRSPALARAHLVQKAFAPRGSKVSLHGTAIASLLAGDDGVFHGAAPKATLYVADVYGPTAAGGSAVAVVRGLAWLVERGVPVINVSLVGPPNALLEAAVSRAVARGHIIVAAVGNDGPAAAPLYPAAYPGVVGVTGLDAKLRVLPEAGRGPQVAFAAPGVDMAAARPGGGYAAVRGTSYAAPLVAGLLARSLTQADPAGARRAVEGLARTASDLGPKGRDPIYGWGAVALDLPVRPAALARR